MDKCLKGWLFVISSSSRSTTRIATTIQTRLYSTRLAEVGRFEQKQSAEHCYQAGQPFLHRIFGYRGVILFPWLARVHDSDLQKSFVDLSIFARSRTNLNESQQSKHNTDNSCSTTPREIVGHPSLSDDEKSGNISSSREMKVKNERDNAHINREKTQSNSTVQQEFLLTNPQSTRFHPYYQVLIDTRDCPFVSSRIQTEAVTFLGHPSNSKSVYPISGLDYVAHEDIMPYTSHEEQPIQHKLHKQLFKYDSNAAESPKYTPNEGLDKWRNKHPWLELSRVYRQTTGNVRVTVIPFYLGHTTIEDTSFYWWRYCVRLENFNAASIQLRERHWNIFSHTDGCQTIKGRGVVGIEPLLTRDEPAYQYSSHVNLQDKSGLVWGKFKMQREDGYTFECEVPRFLLESSLSSSQVPTDARA